MVDLFPQSSAQPDLQNRVSKELHDPALSHLREEIKQVMLPLLIRIFELKAAAAQATASPSRLIQAKQEPIDQIAEKLQQLLKDLHLLGLFCQSAAVQATKALDEINKETPCPPPL